MRLDGLHGQAITRPLSHDEVVRSRIEAKMRCLKAFGERIAARDPDRQTAEIHMLVA